MRITSSTSRTVRKRSLALILLTSLSVLAGCHRLTPDQQLTAWADSGGKSIPTFMTSEEIKQMEERHYLRVVRNTLSYAVYRTNSNRLQGSIKLRMKLDRRGDVLLCEAKPTDATPSSGLANLAQDACWSSVWQPVPEGLQNPADGSLEIILPLISANTQPLTDYEAGRQRMAAEERFLWENLVARQSINAFGSAHFLLTGNEKGEVVQCDVELSKNYSRPDYFHPDSALQQRLAQQCLQLDLRQMPGFKVGPDGTAKRVVWVDYLPWKNHVGEY